MRHYYVGIARASAHWAGAQRYLHSLAADERAMLAALPALRIDHYALARLPGKPEHYDSLITHTSLPYLYASRRYFIPFGWYANPLPSTCASAWIIMLADHFDPLGYAGSPAGDVSNH
jgi:hypothetical protein